MELRTRCSGLSVANELYELIVNDILPGTGISSEHFWAGFSNIIHDLSPKNRELLEIREQMQSSLDRWHRDNPAPYDAAAYRAFLEEIGYLLPEGEPFQITTDRVDPEIASLAGPQLVVPISNARFALNAANARWGSLYDAFYGTDVLEESEGLHKGPGFNTVRGQAVIRMATDLLDQVAPLQNASHDDVVNYRLEEVERVTALVAELADGKQATLQDSNQLAGYRRQDNELKVLLCSNGLHFELQLDRSHPIGKLSTSGMKDILLESALTAIQDCEDSVAAVDAADKVHVYRNWLGLMKGTLEDTFEKSGQMMTRRLSQDRSYTATDGSGFTLPGRALLLVRNVGHLMTSDAIMDREGREVPEGIMDGMVTVLCALHNRSGNTMRPNSRTGSIYIVKPKMHGPEEVAFANDLFDRIEDFCGLPRHTVKMGIMDEERRTTVNLKECIRAASGRVVFINTGFLDRTGDEIHTSMEAGAMLRKEAIKDQPWIKAYEDWNVDIGLECGFRGKAQIGKGMWAMPDEMKAMVDSKMGHLEAGANCAWVPSPTAATLHAIHYLQYSVEQRQAELMSRERASLDDILSPPLLGETSLSTADIEAELENNAQGILGYVVRWIDHGVGCSKVPDINNIGLMEDRATLRISSQHICNWLHHGICEREQVIDTLKKMAAVVDEQNSGDPAYQAMATDPFASVAFQAACDLVFQGREQPSGYTEPLLHARRREAKGLPAATG